jgi:hypothetical protein
MQVFAIVHFLNEKGKPPLHIFKDSVLPEIDFLDYERSEEAFLCSIVLGIC